MTITIGSSSVDNDANVLKDDECEISSSKK